MAQLRSDCEAVAVILSPSASLRTGSAKDLGFQPSKAASGTIGAG